jgi:cytochrome c oxidase assembly protein subunit 11
VALLGEHVGASPRCRSTLVLRTTGWRHNAGFRESAGSRSGRTITIRFDSTSRIAASSARQNEIKVQIGEVATVSQGRQQAAREMSGRLRTMSRRRRLAPISKINCFCFAEQRMKSGETREMTVVFYVDPQS